MPGTATYLYCVIQRATPPRLSRVPSGLPGASRASVLAVSKSLWLVVAHVPLEMYGPDRLEPALRDMRWVGEIALAHETVIEYFTRMPGGTVIPMKLFTMFSTDDRAVQEIGVRRRSLEGVARRIAGSEEWGVRITRTPRVGAGHRGGPGPRIPSARRVASGADFLAAKKQARDAVRDAATTATLAAAEALDALSAIARDMHRRTDAPDGAVSPPLVDAAFLVPVGRRTRFRTMVRRTAADCRKAGADLTLTGPWPAYNFVRTEDDGA
jgi:hypothetical protein